MSDAAQAVTGAAPETMHSAGTLLRLAREKTGLHIGALAVSLKVPPSKLEALEADRLDLLPDAVFARALAASVCRTLKLDPATVLSRLPDHRAGRLQLGAKVKPVSFDTPGMGWRMPILSRLSRPAVITVALLLVAALLVLFVPSLDLLEPMMSAKTGESTQRAGSLTAPVQVQPGFGAMPSAAPSVVPAAPVAPLATDPGTSVGPLPITASLAGSANGATTAVSDATAGPPSSAPGLVVFKARGPSWVEVTDAAGVVQLRKTLVQGESVEASGAMPLSVVVGRIDSTDVLVRGKPFDLAPFGKNNTARFQIK